MSETSVITPGTLRTPLPKEVEAEREEMSRRDQQIKNLATDPGWLKVRKEFEKHIDRLENVQALVTDSKDDAEVGRKAKINIEAAHVLRGVLAEVDVHAEPEQ